MTNGRVAFGVLVSVIAMTVLAACQPAFKVEVKADDSTSSVGLNTATLGSLQAQVNGITANRDSIDPAIVTGSLLLTISGIEGLSPRQIPVDFQAKSNGAILNGYVQTQAGEPGMAWQSQCSEMSCSQIRLLVLVDTHYTAGTSRREQYSIAIVASGPNQAYVKIFPPNANISFQSAMAQMPAAQIQQF